MRDANKTAGTCATVAGSPAALGLAPYRRASTGRMDNKAIAELRADLVIGPASYEAAQVVAWNLDCGRNSGLALIADLEGLETVLTAGATARAIASHLIRCAL
jgi:hypothetical protein